MLNSESALKSIITKRTQQNRQGHFLPCLFKQQTYFFSQVFCLTLAMEISISASSSDILLPHCASTSLMKVLILLTAAMSLLSFKYFFFKYLLNKFLSLHTDTLFQHIICYARPLLPLSTIISHGGVLLSFN